mmetsp:Transcript_8174/g.16490  ORF Transcript_8174/g.16490 Transcript_8174/m.16490 type:complete len:88 (-) Transcript_8174:1570-1833(-)
MYTLTTSVLIRIFDAPPHLESSGTWNTSERLDFKFLRGYGSTWDLWVTPVEHESVYHRFPTKRELTGYGQPGSSRDPKSDDTSPAED